MINRVCFTKVFGLAAATILLSASSVQAGFHLWTLREVYTDNSGSLQFIEMFDPTFGGQQFVSGFTISVTDVGNTQTHNFTFPGNAPGDSFNHALLLGTAGLQAAGGPTPDFIIPNNFLFGAGGSISFFNASGPYTALPTDGVNSRTWGGGNAPNSPQNYAGQVGFITVPEPASAILLLSGGILFAFARRK